MNAGRDLVDLAELPFAYRRTDANIRYRFRGGAWSPALVTSDANLTLPIAAVCLHYGQAIFEGLKAYEHPDGKVYAFRPWDNARRFRRSALKLVMEPVPEELFLEGVFLAIRNNRRFVPEYGCGASLYIRPFEIGVSADLGLKPSREYLFAVFVVPVGSYFGDGGATIRLLIREDLDRAAPQGIGDVKAAANYAASLRGTVDAKARGYTEVLYTDARSKRFLDESGASNLFAVRGGSLITPASPSILPGITKLCVQQLAQDIGLLVEDRAVSVDELPSFDEVGLMGTAAGITPVHSITYRDEEISYGEDGAGGPVTATLGAMLAAIQSGEGVDSHGWCEVVPGA